MLITLTGIVLIVIGIKGGKVKYGKEKITRCY